MKPTAERISFSHCMWVTLIVLLWTMLVIVLMTALPSDNNFKPTVWLFISSTLILMFSIKRFGGNIQATLGLQQVHIFWGLIAVGLGVIYWYVDFWVTNHLFNSNPTKSIQTWRQANAAYLPITVIFSSVILAPFFEELLFRGLLFRSMAFRLHWLLAACITAVLFAAIHWSWPEFISLFIAGFIYAMITHKSASIIPAIMAHMTHNLITYFHYTQY